MRATAKQAREMIKAKDYDDMHLYFLAHRNDKRRNCVFCGINIKAGQPFAMHFEFPYESNQLRWFACEKCFKKARGGS